MTVGQNAVATAFDDGDTVAQFALGTRMKGAGDREYVYVQADGAVAATDFVILDDAWQADQLDTTNSAGKIGQLCGVSEGALADNEYGWIQIFGTCTGNVGTGTAEGDVVNSTGTAGRVDDDATSGAETLEGVHVTATAASNAAVVTLSYPRILATL